MNRKTFFLVLAIAILVFFPGFVKAAYFPRPWDNTTWVAQNPYIWNNIIEYWFGVSDFHQTISGMNLQDTASLPINGTAASLLYDALIHAESADRDERTCSRTLFDMGMQPITPITLSVKAFDVFSSIPACLSYRSDWINTINPSLGALETSMDSASISMRSAREAYNELKRSGLCERNYTLSGSGYCTRMQSAFGAIDNNITEGSYGKYPLFLNYSKQMRMNLLEPVPDLSLYRSSMELVWEEGGILDMFNRMVMDAKIATKEAGTEFQIEANMSKQHKETMSAKLGYLSGQETGSIDRGPESTEIHAVGKISDRFEGMRASEYLRSDGFDKACAIRNGMKEGYLSRSILALVSLNKDYEDAIAGSDSLLEDAKSTEAQAGLEARDEIRKTEAYMKSAQAGPDAQKFLDEAKADYDKGQTGSTIGKRYVSFSKSAELARLARSSQSYQEIMNQSSSLSELESLVNRAETDGLNVAAEKSDLKILRTMAGADISGYIESDRISIISKARVRYDDDLLGARKRILEKLSLAGPEAADLYTDLDRYEEGIFSRQASSGPASSHPVSYQDDPQIDYPNAIGKLRKLGSDYDFLEKTVDQYMVEIVGNSMSVSASPMVGYTELDKPSDISVDALLSNNHPYGADNVTARIYLKSADAGIAGITFAYPDLTEGRDGVSSIVMDTKTSSILIKLTRVDPFETKRIILEKSLVIAHTKKRQSNAEGLGDGSAQIIGETTFDLECRIQKLELPPGVDPYSATIDGGPPDSPLAAGTHSLAYESFLVEAYSQTIRNIDAFPIGKKSQVEYDVDVLPDIDLDSAIVLADILNHSNVSSIEASSVTGEIIKDKHRVSPTQYSIRIMGLKEGRASTIRISYLVDDTSSFVQDQISQLDHANLSPDAQDLLVKARTQADDGNYTLALEYLEKAKALEKTKAAEQSKLQSKYDEYSKKLNDELAELDRILAKSKGYGGGNDSIRPLSGNDTSPLVPRLESRKIELEKILSQTEGMNLSGKTDALEKIDYGWLDKEISAFRKDSIARYNDLKERYYKTGNTSLPDSFSDFESSLNKLDASNNAEYASDILESLARIVSDVIIQENHAIEEKSGMSAMLERVRSDIAPVLESYIREAASAKGTDYESVFSETEKNVNKKISDAESALGKDPRIFQMRLDDIERSRKSMLITLDTLRNQSENKLAIIENALNRSDIDETSRKNITDKASAIRQMIGSGRYVNALRASDSLIKQLESISKRSDSSLVLLGLSAAAILATIAVYLFTQKNNDAPDLASFPPFSFFVATKKRKTLRRLERTKGPVIDQESTEPEHATRP